MKQSKNNIGRLNEYTIHAQLKELYETPDSVCESPVGNYIIDVIDKGKLIEIQTKNFSGIRKKLEKLVEKHPVLLIAPLPAVTHIVVMDENNEHVLYRRKSPKKNAIQGIASELCRITSVLDHPNFTLKVLLTEEEDIRINDGKGSWRRKGISLADRKLVAILEEHLFSEKKDYLRLLPPQLFPPSPSEEFTNSDIFRLMKIPLRTAQQITYCLKKISLIEVTRKSGKKQFFKLV